MDTYAASFFYAATFLFWTATFFFTRRLFVCWTATFCFCWWICRICNFYFAEINCVKTPIWQVWILCVYSGSVWTQSQKKKVAAQKQKVAVQKCFMTYEKEAICIQTYENEVMYHDLWERSNMYPNLWERYTCASVARCDWFHAWCFCIREGENGIFPRGVHNPWTPSHGARILFCDTMIIDCRRGKQTL